LKSEQQAEFWDGNQWHRAPATTCFKLVKIHIQIHCCPTGLRVEDPIEIIIGNCSASCSRSFGGNALVAASILATVLIMG